MGNTVINRADGSLRKEGSNKNNNGTIGASSKIKRDQASVIIYIPALRKVAPIPGGCKVPKRSSRHQGPSEQ